jgi:DNA-binding transcriptional MerR regulator
MVQAGRSGKEVGVRIGELARLAGVPPATIRYYERRGVLRRPERSPSGYRSYPAEAGLQLRLIRWAKGVGFTLREVRELMQLVREHSERPSDHVRSRFDAKRREIEARMRDLAAIRERLAELAACRCEGSCPIIARAIREAPEARTRRRR